MDVAHETIINENANEDGENHVKISALISIAKMLTNKKSRPREYCS